VTLVRLTCFVASLLLFASSAAASPRDDRFVSRAESLMDEAEYARAQKVIDRGLARERLGADVKKALYLLEGTCWVSLGKRSRARSSYAKVLTIDPAYKVGTATSPKVREVFAETRAEMVKSGALESAFQVQHTPPGNLLPGQDAQLALAFRETSRAEAVARVVLYLRRAGTSDFAAVDATPDDEGAWAARVPPYLVAQERETYAMEYYLEAYGEGSEARLTGAGTAALPLGFLVIPPAALAEGEQEAEAEPGFPIVPVAVGAGVGAAVLIAAGAVGAFFLLAPQTGSATVTVTQATP
jgi:hypothetical protein